MLSLTELHKTFNVGTANEVRALQGVNLKLDPADFLVILGGNGSGKSTLLNAVAGNFMVDQGCIELAGKDITRWEDYKRAQLIGRVFQNPFLGTAAKMSIAENFAIAASRGLRRGLRWALGRRFLDQLRERVAGLRMGLENRLDTPMGALSGGQRQALTLLMATWHTPSLLLLDEHTAALDPKSAEQVISLTKEVVHREHITTLMVTHSMQQAVNLGNRLIVVQQGTVYRDYTGLGKQRLRVDELLGVFGELRQRDLLDESAAVLLRETYV